MPVPLYARNPLGPAFAAFALAPSDTVAIASQLKGIYVGTAGDVTLRAQDSPADVVFKAVPAGTMLEVNATYVRATGTTATNLVALA